MVAAGPEKHDASLLPARAEDEGAGATASAPTVAGPTAGPDSDSLVGKLLSHYRIVRRLGVGGMGEVFLADDTSLRRAVALKCLPPALRRDDRHLRRFVREARLAAALSHPYVCGVHEVVEAEGLDLIVMEYVEGQTLRERLATGPVPVPESLRLALEIAEALEHAHGRGVVHRDLKPANVMLAAEGHVKVMDFGLAKRVHDPGEATSSLTAEGTTLGTLAYMAPEQLRGEEADARSDLFSFGVVLYEIVAGVHPFRRATTAQTVSQILSGEAPALSQLRPGVPEPLERIIHRLLSREPDRRYPSAGEVRSDLARVARELDRGAGEGALAVRGVLGRPVVVVPALALVLVLAFVTVAAILQARRARWAREVALPAAEQALNRDDYTTAFTLVGQAGKSIPKDPRYLDLAPLTRGAFSLRSDPPGAEVLVRDYGASSEEEWRSLGRTPLKKVWIPRGFQRFQVHLAGYEPVEGAAWVYHGESPWAPDLDVHLDRVGTMPTGMVRIRGGAFRPTLLQGLPELTLSDYLLDRYEVTNRQFKEFVDAGGYREPGFWRETFVHDGRAITRETAMKLFVDKTGRPGPSTWELGDYPEGQADYPVCGVSWYEAAAYAEFAGKSLPTIHHWNYAAVNRVDPYIQNTDYLGALIHRSNFGEKGPRPVGSSRAMTPRGIDDMAGNVKEWARNSMTDGPRVILGGAWDEPQYMYVSADRYPPATREHNFGLRCMKLLADDDASREAARPVRPNPVSAPVDHEPCGDDVFRVYRKLYDYPRSDLRARVEARQDVDSHTRLERVSFDAAYGNERVIAYLFIPTSGTPPFQAVIHFPGGAAVGMIPKTLDYSYEGRMRWVTRTGRAWVLPVMWGTFERGVPPEETRKTDLLEQTIKRVKDFRRTIDYLETRSDIDAGKLVYEGLSWGAWFGAILPGVEERLKAAVLLGGGLDTDDSPEYSPFNFAPRIHVPVLMQNGKYDFIFPLETSAKPLLRLFGTPERDKELKVYETGHAVWLTHELFRDEVAFLDAHVGPAQ